MTKLPFALLFAAAAATASSAEVLTCDLYPKLAANLTREYGEILQATGDIREGRMELWVNPTTLTWSIVNMEDQDIACLMHSGKKWTVAPKALEAEITALQGDLSDAERASLAESGAVEALRQRLDGVAATLTQLEKDKLADLAAAEALREKLRNSDTELTAMTLALEEQRKKAEETLTLLAAAQASADAAKTAAAVMSSPCRRASATPGLLGSLGAGR